MQERTLTQKLKKHSGVGFKEIKKYELRKLKKEE